MASAALSFQEQTYANIRSRFNRSKQRKQRNNLCSLRFLLFNSGRDTVLAGPKSDEGGPPCVDNPEDFRGEPELREYKAVFVVGYEEVSQFSNESPVNCAPMVRIPGPPLT